MNARLTDAQPLARRTRPLTDEEKRIKVAALFVQEGGCYSGILEVDAWPESRDARFYSGPHPVVAHPPCQRWGKMARVNYARWGGRHNQPGNDGGCFLSALLAVREWGGVLEHPAQTYAFAEYSLPRPTKGGWGQAPCGGWVCEVWQSAYGHRANKATWLYYVGNLAPFELDWSRPIGTHQVGYQDRRGKARNKPTLSSAEANATPHAFRDELIALAAHSRLAPSNAATFFRVKRQAHVPNVPANVERTAEDWNG